MVKAAPLPGPSVKASVPCCRRPGHSSPPKPKRSRFILYRYGPLYFPENDDLFVAIAICLCRLAIYI